MKIEEIDYIIVQAGGKGTRLDYLTVNKPKALVPINNRPMLFHLFEIFPDKHFIIIADYKSDVMENYLFTFAKVKYLIVKADGKTGTCSGIKNAVEKIPADKAFMLIWSDLVLPKDFTMPKKINNYIGISKNFRCRWSYHLRELKEVASETSGVAGLFIFKNKQVLNNVPSEGEFVRWLAQKNDIDWEKLPLYKTKEFGILSEYEKYVGEKIEYRCRPFNKLTVKENIIIKEPLDEQGSLLARREKAWYQFVKKYNYKQIPQIITFEPFAMERIGGKNIFEYDLSEKKQKIILKNIVDALKRLHKLRQEETDYFSIYETYYSKTMRRLNKVRNLIPLANRQRIRINGKECRNIFFCQQALNKRIHEYRCPFFSVIHGDNTFSNIMLDGEQHPIFIDPRGYFGFSEIMGDPAYDWAKLYYSLFGNYDQFNLKRFQLKIQEDEVKLTIESNGWEQLKDVYFQLLEGEVKRDDIQLIHAIIWLSLTTYAWEDYDSICGAFYNGLYYLEDIL